MNKEKIRVGICVPVYEKLDLFKRAIASIQKQDYKNYVVFVTDNSSSDLIEKYLKDIDDRNIIYHHNEINLGASGNLNRALSLAIEYGVDVIKILFQDDWFTYNNSLEKMVYELFNTAADVIFTGNLEVYPDKIFEHICSEEQIEQVEKDTSFLFRGNCLGAPSNVLYKTDAVFFDSAYTWLLDVDFYLRLLPGKKIEYIYEPLISIGHDGTQLTDYYSQKPKLMLKETFRQYKKYRWLHSRINHIHLYLYSWKIVKKSIKKLL